MLAQAPKTIGKVSENKFVRTDSMLRTLDSFLHASAPTPAQAAALASAKTLPEKHSDVEDVVMEEAETVAEQRYAHCYFKRNESQALTTG